MPPNIPKPWTESLPRNLNLACHLANGSTACTYKLRFHWLLTHWGPVMHIWVSKLTIIGSNNGLSPGRGQAIIWTNAGILLIVALGTNFSEILIEIDTISFKKIHFKMSSGKWWPFCLSLNVFRRLEGTPCRHWQTEMCVILCCHWLIDLHQHSSEIAKHSLGSRLGIF